MALLINAVLFVFLTALPAFSRRLHKDRVVSLQKGFVEEDLKISGLSAMQEVATLEEFNKLLVDSKGKGKTVIVDFTATWCGPCQQIKPVFEKLEKEFPHVVFCKVDVDDNAETAQKYGVRAFPTFMAFREGEMSEELKGADPQGLRNLVEKHQGEKSWGQGQTLGTASGSENGAAQVSGSSASSETLSASRMAAESAMAREKRAAALAKRGL